MKMTIKLSGEKSEIANALRELAAKLDQDETIEQVVKVASPSGETALIAETKKSIKMEPAKSRAKTNHKAITKLEQAASAAIMLCANLRDAHSESCIENPTPADNALEYLLLDLIGKAATIKDILGAITCK